MFFVICGKNALSSSYEAIKKLSKWVICGRFDLKFAFGGTAKSSFVLKVPLRNLRPSKIYSVPCDWILQKAISGHESLHFLFRVLLNSIHFLLFTFFFPFSKTIADKIFFRCLFAQRIFCVFIISVAVISLLRHLLNLTRISNLITNIKSSSSDKRFP